MTEKYRFEDDIERKDVEGLINRLYEKGWRFKAFLQYEGEYDGKIGILFIYYQ